EKQYSAEQAAQLTEEAAAGWQDVDSQTFNSEISRSRVEALNEAVSKAKESSQNYQSVASAAKNLRMSHSEDARAGDRAMSEDNKKRISNFINNEADDQTRALANKKADMLTPIYGDAAQAQRVGNLLALMESDSPEARALAANALAETYGAGPQRDASRYHGLEMPTSVEDLNEKKTNIDPSTLERPEQRTTDPAEKFKSDSSRIGGQFNANRGNENAKEAAAQRIALQAQEDRGSASAYNLMTLDNFLGDLVDLAK